MYVFITGQVQPAPQGGLLVLIISQLCLALPSHLEGVIPSPHNQGGCHFWVPLSSTLITWEGAFLPPTLPRLTCWGQAGGHFPCLPGLLVRRWGAATAWVQKQRAGPRRLQLAAPSFLARCKYLVFTSILPDPGLIVCANCSSGKIWVALKPQKTGTAQRELKHY